MVRTRWVAGGWGMDWVIGRVRGRGVFWWGGAWGGWQWVGGRGRGVVVEVIIVFLVVSLGVGGWG